VPIKTDGLLEFGKWTLRCQVPEGEGPAPVLLLIHGWTGNENVMWIFTSRLSPRYLILSPRGLFPAPEGGYGWEPHSQPGELKVDDFRPAVDDLLCLLDDISAGDQSSLFNIARPDFSKLNILGFSQGAALAYTLALLHPERIQRLAGLAGFLPVDAANLVGSRPLLDKPVFVAHGHLDKRVPVERARAAVSLLEEAGANVSYCEEEIGHKLAVSCFNNLEQFFAL
jgi:phospholipase/carboxylesterase